MNRSFSYKLLSIFSGFKTELNQVDISDFKVKLRKNILIAPEPAFNKLSETYTLIRKLLFHPEININIMQEFKSLLKWNMFNLHYSTVLRNYPLKFEVNTEKMDYSDIHLPEHTKLNEEIVHILPYVRKVNKKKLFKIPVTKRPVYKSYFSREDIRQIREKVAEQNKTGWANIEIFEIYDKFHYNFFSNMKQIPGSKELECMPNPTALNKTPEEVFYLIIGRKRDSGEPVKAIINPADIKN